ANTLGLWSSDMGRTSNSGSNDPAAFGGISFNGSNPSRSKYVRIAGRQNHPVNHIDWYSAIRFANWLNNGQGTGDTETGAYTLGTLGAGGVPITPPLTHNGGAQGGLPQKGEG